MKTEETKSGMDMMSEMMKYMMENMMRGKKVMHGMPEMCFKIMEQMAASKHGSPSITSYATEEMRGLFEEWLKNLEDEIMEFVREKGKVSPDDLTSKLKLSRESVLFLVGKLAREGKLTIGEIRTA